MDRAAFACAVRRNDFHQSARALLAFFDSPPFGCRVALRLVTLPTSATGTVVHIMPAPVSEQRIHTARSGLLLASLQRVYQSAGDLSKHAPVRESSRSP